MAGETDLHRLLSSMQPELHPGEYVFTTIARGGVPDGVNPVVTVRETEGLTLVVPRDEADAAGLPYDYVAAWITLRVHSALEAVGLTASFGSALAGAGLSCNVVAGFHHDHLFVQHERADDALAVLLELAANADTVN